MGYLLDCDTRLAQFFDTPAKQLNNAGISKRIVHKAGYYTNKMTYSISNKVGDSLVKSSNAVEKALNAGQKALNAGQKAGFFGKLVFKSKFLTNIATGLSTLGKNGAAKIPGVGTLLTFMTSIFGVGKAIYHYATGDTQKGHHQLVKTAFSTVGLIAGLALAATPIGFPIALLIGMGSGFLMDSLGEMVADKVFPKAKETKETKEDNTPKKPVSLDKTDYPIADSPETSNNDPFNDLMDITIKSPPPTEEDLKIFDDNIKKVDEGIKELEEFTSSFNEH